MSSTKREKQPTFAQQLPQITAKFWSMVEQRCMLDGIPVLEREYYGIRPEDRVQLKVTVDGAEQIVACTVSELWRRYVANLGGNADLFIASQSAVAASLLKSSMRRGKDKTDPSKTRSYGVQFWTPENTLFLAKKSLSPDAAAVTPQHLIDALLGDVPEAPQS